MTQRKLHHLLDHRQLLAHSSEVIVADVVDVVLVVFALDRLLDVDIRGGNDDAAGRRIDVGHLELDGAHSSVDDDDVTLVDGTEGISQVWLEEHFEDVSEKGE